jgi:hypothetical protein
MGDSHSEAKAPAIAKLANQQFTLSIMVTLPLTLLSGIQQRGGD